MTEVRQHDDGRVAVRLEPEGAPPWVCLSLEGGVLLRVELFTDAEVADWAVMTIGGQ